MSRVSLPPGIAIPFFGPLARPGAHLTAQPRYATPAARQTLLVHLQDYFTETGHAWDAVVDFRGGSLIGLYASDGAPQIFPAIMSGAGRSPREPWPAVAQRSQEVMETMGVHLRALREQIGLTQDLAGARIGYDPSTIRNAENGAPRAGISAQFWADMIFGLRRQRRELGMGIRIDAQTSYLEWQIVERWKMALRDWIYVHRILKGLSSKDVAAAAGFGTSFYSEVEKSQTPPVLRTWIRMAAAIDLLPDRLPAAMRKRGVRDIRLQRQLRGYNTPELALAAQVDRRWLSDIERRGMTRDPAVHQHLLDTIALLPQRRMPLAQMRPVMSQVFGPRVLAALRGETLAARADEPPTRTLVYPSASPSVSAGEIIEAVEAKTTHFLNRLGPHIRELRKQRRIPTRAVAAAVPMNERYLIDIEAKKHVPNAQLFAQIVMTIRAMEYHRIRTTFDPYILDLARAHLEQWKVALRHSMIQQRWLRGLRYEDLLPYLPFDPRGATVPRLERRQQQPPLRQWAWMHVLFPKLPSRIPLSVAGEGSLRMLRLTRGLNERRAAELACVTQEALRDHERGVRPFASDERHEIADVFSAMAPTFLPPDQILPLLRSIFGAKITDLLEL
jgi:transcriptional regulator with XRE-family HTH domain